MKLEIKKIGNSLGIVFPEEIIKRFSLKENDSVTFEFKNEIINLSFTDPEFEEWAEAYREANTDYKDELKKLS